MNLLVIIFKPASLPRLQSACWLIWLKLRQLALNSPQSLSKQRSPTSLRNLSKTTTSSHQPEFVNCMELDYPDRHISCPLLLISSREILMDTSLFCHVLHSRMQTPQQEMFVFARALLCVTKGSVGIYRTHLLLLAGFFCFPVLLLILKQNPALSFLCGLTVCEKMLNRRFAFRNLYLAFLHTSHSAFLHLWMC